jgi:hypothetical protein
MLIRLLLLLSLLLAGCKSAQPQSSDNPWAVDLPPRAATTAPAADYAAIQKVLGQGTLSNGVLTIVFPRTDLRVDNELGDIPVEAGLASTLHFFPCPCGRMSMVGQLCVLEHEANDLIEEFAAARIKVVSVGPMLLGERPRLLMIRIQADGAPAKLATSLDTALSWTGPRRALK